MWCSLNLNKWGFFVFLIDVEIVLCMVVVDEWYGLDFIYGYYMEILSLVLFLLLVGVVGMGSLFMVV